MDIWQAIGALAIPVGLLLHIEHRLTRLEATLNAHVGGHIHLVAEENSANGS